jgi:hypothetical protein
MGACDKGGSATVIILASSSPIASYGTGRNFRYGEVKDCIYNAVQGSEFGDQLVDFGEEIL